jgi:hypothetical protein
MSRTTLCALTAAALAASALGVMALRRHALGDEVRQPWGRGNWTVTLAVRGTSLGKARLQTAAPLDVGRQHVVSDRYDSTELAPRPPEPSRPGSRPVQWAQRAAAPGPFRARCVFRVALDVSHPNALMARQAAGLYAAPKPGEHLELASGPDAGRLAELARRLTAGLDNPTDVAEALYHHVDREVRNEPALDGPPAGAAECLKSGSGDCGAKARLLAALVRHRGLPARVVTGLALAKGPEQREHYWVEAWVHDRWLPMCPFHHHFGRVPATYLVFGFGDQPAVRGREVKGLDYAFLVEHAPPEDGAAASPLRRAFRAVSLFALPPAERRLVEVLLLLPVAALIICVFRNVVGLSSFGTFAPALIGLAFHELNSLPGIGVFVAILLVGWGMRRVLDRYHLLQVPRVAVMLTLIMAVLIGTVVAANRLGTATTAYIALFPVVILTGMVERFWTLEAEDGAAASFRTLLHTMLIATAIALVLGLRALAQHLFRYPETLGLVMAAQLLLGRYTGYRLTELLRFRDFLTPAPGPGYRATLEGAPGGDA